MVGAIVVGIVAVFGFTIISTLMAVGKSSFRRNMFSNESIEDTQSSIVRRECIAWAKMNGKLSE